MEQIRQKFFKGERALFGSRGLELTDCIFDDGESPLKESRDIVLRNSMFKWKYPLWYAKNIRAENCAWFEMARAGVWYSENIEISGTIIQAPKNFRRCRNLTLRDVSIPDALETLWSCENVKLENVSAKGNYFAMNCSDMTVDGLVLDGNYSFDGAKNVTVRNSRMLSKDSFWNSENVTVYDSFISGEYLGWNSKNLTLENCTVESLQGMCYIDGLRMVNCRLLNTTLAFEYSTVEAQIDSRIDSVFNPSGGTINARAIGELIIEKDKIDPDKTMIICRDIDKRSDRPAWIPAPAAEK